MLERGQSATVIEFDACDYVIDRDRIIKSAETNTLDQIYIGLANRQQLELEVDKNNTVHVEMNSSGRLALEKNQDGFIATSSLNGCTGVAGYVKLEDGKSLQFVSHYDPMSQSFYFTRESNPIIDQLYSFKHDVLTVNPNSLIQLFAAYPAQAHWDPRFGDRSTPFDEWFYLDQLHKTASILGNNIQFLFLPYKLNFNGHTLVAGRENGNEGIFWNGNKVDFSKYLE